MNRHFPSQVLKIYTGFSQQENNVKKVTPHWSVSVEDTENFLCYQDIDRHNIYPRKHIEFVKDKFFVVILKPLWFSINLNQEFFIPVTGDRPLGSDQVNTLIL